jgi:hypothetical protein
MKILIVIPLINLLVYFYGLTSASVSNPGTPYLFIY